MVHKKPTNDFAVTQGGSRAFRLLNPELYVRPTGMMRAVGYAGECHRH